MRIAVVSVAVGIVLGMAPPTLATTVAVPMPTPPDPLPAPAVDGLYPMPFPIQTDPANYTYSDTFGHCRSGCSRGHFGVDIMTYGNKGRPVVAVADGTITWTSSSCCALSITHDDGWKSYYIHLNNDSQNPDGSYNDDGTEWYPPGIFNGARVERGQVLGTAGDSGNAEACNCPHVHFELWAPADLNNPNWRERQVLVNPTPHVQAAESVPIDPEQGERPCDEGPCDAVGFIDVGSEWSLFDSLSAEASVADFYFGDPGDVPFMGDWDGDGVATPGLYRQSDGFVYLRNSNTQGVADTTFFFGDPGDYPLVGDFDGDGDDTVSIYRQSEGRVYVVNELGEDGGGLGAADYDFFFGNPGDTPFVGDFDGDFIDSVGLYRTSTGFVYFRNELSTGIADLEFFYGNPGDVILAGDWDGDGDDTVAVFRPASGRVYVSLENGPGVADYTLYVGPYATAVTYRRSTG